MKKNKMFKYILNTIALFLALLLLNNCKKNVEKIQETNSLFDLNKFFRGSESVDLSTKRIVTFFKNKQDKNADFLPNLVRNCGYPIWDKLMYNYPNKATIRSTNGDQDSVIHLPFVKENSTEVNAFVEAIINDTIAVEIFEKKKYTLLPKGSIESSTFTAERYLNQFFLLQKKVFNHHFYKIKDSLLFKNFLPNNLANNTSVNYIKIDEVVNSTGSRNLRSTDGCWHYTTYYSTTEVINGEAIVTRNSIHHTICFINNGIQTIQGGDSGGGPIGSIGSLDWFGVGGFSLNTNGNNSNGNNTYTQAQNSNTNTNVGFIDYEEALQLFTQLKLKLPNLDINEEIFLIGHIGQMREILNSLTAQNNQLNIDRCLIHIDKMINDNNYLNKVINRSIASTNVTVWWDDLNWIINEGDNILNPIKLNNIDKTNIINPNLKSILDKFTYNSYKTFILKTYFNVTANSVFTRGQFRLKFTEVYDLKDNNGLQIPAKTLFPITTGIDEKEIEIQINLPLLFGKSKEWVTSTILHELSHGILMATNTAMTNNDDQHDWMFLNGAPKYIGESLRELFPIADYPLFLDEHTKSLGLDGLAHAYSIPNPNIPGAVMIDPAKDIDCIRLYGISLINAIPTILAYKTLLAGTPF
jgi:hypothetical protein